MFSYLSCAQGRDVQKKIELKQSCSKEEGQGGKKYVEKADQHSFVGINAGAIRSL
jgi:hypothetical protein